MPTPVSLSWERVREKAAPYPETGAGVGVARPPAMTGRALASENAYPEPWIKLDSYRLPTLPRFDKRERMYDTASGTNAFSRCDSPESYKMLQNVTNLREMRESVLARGLSTKPKGSTQQFYNNNRNTPKCLRMSHFSK